MKLMHTCFQGFISVINLLHSIETVDNAVNSLCLERGKHSMWLFSENFCCVRTPKERMFLYEKISEEIEAYPMDKCHISQHCSISTFSPFRDLPSPG